MSETRPYGAFAHHSQTESPALSGSAEAEVQEAGDRRRRGILLGTGEEPVGRGRLDHVLEDQAVVGQRIEIRATTAGARTG